MSPSLVQKHSHPLLNSGARYMDAQAMHASNPFNSNNSMLPSTSKPPISVSNTEGTAATSPTDTGIDNSSDDGNETVELGGDSDAEQDRLYANEGEGGHGDVDDNLSAEEDAEGSADESGADDYETSEQRNGRIQQGGRRPASTITVRKAHGGLDGANEYTDEEDDDNEGTTNGDIEGDEDDAQSGYSSSSASSEDSDDPEKVDSNVAEEMEKFEATFKGFSKRFRLINKIGEGTFSSVYKAEDLEYDRYDNSWDINYKEDARWAEPPSKKRRTGEPPAPRKPKYVAVKKIYVTSSPARIQNELELLHDLSGCDSVVPLITAFRCQDQVVAVLPYFKHVDFREYFRALTIPDIRLYFRSLFKALAHVHLHGIIHRDIKPTNFLYDYRYGRGVLVDFGLAEREGTDSQFCMCQHTSNDRREFRAPTLAAPSVGYPKQDSRPSRRANRAGTRGFRAPEVLFKCTNQTTKIDIWSAGVILLTILSRRFPFFNSSDDVDAMIEIATIFGKQKMKQCAALHGCIFETTISTIGERGFTLEKIVLWATNRTATGSSRESKDDQQLPPEEALAVKFMQRCFELDPAKRISADEALQHEFLTTVDEEECNV